MVCHCFIAFSLYGRYNSERCEKDESEEFLYHSHSVVPGAGGCCGTKKEGGAPPDDIIGGRAIPGGGACEEAPPTFLLPGFITSTYFERTPLLPMA